MKWLITYAVSGVGAFPVDMLRYDSSWPSRTEDANTISSTFERGFNPKPNIVTLCRWSRTKDSHNPTIDRWKSFGWFCSVVDKRKIS